MRGGLIRGAAAVWPIHRENRSFEERMCTGRRRKGGEKMNHVQAFLREEDGVGVVEIILILVVLISLVIIFKKQLTSLVNSILKKITSQSEGI